MKKKRRRGIYINSKYHLDNVFNFVIVFVDDNNSGIIVYDNDTIVDGNVVVVVVVVVVWIGWLLLLEDH